MILPIDLDAVGRHGDLQVDGSIVPHADILHEGQMAVFLVLDRPVSVAVIRHAHRVVAAAQQGFLDGGVGAVGAAEEVAAHGDLVRPIGVVEVVVGQAEAVVTGAQRPVPVFVLGARTAVQFHDLVARKFLEMLLAGTYGSIRVVHLDKVRAASQVVQLELFLRGEQGNQVIEVDDLFAAEDQLVVFKQVVAVLIDVHLEGGVVRMHRELVVVGEGDDIVVELLQIVIDFAGPEFALVQRAFHTRVTMKEGAFPAIRRIQFPVGIEDVRPLEGSGRAETVNGGYTGHTDHEQEDDKGQAQRLENVMNNRSNHYKPVFKQKAEPLTCTPSSA